MQQKELIKSQIWLQGLNWLIKPIWIFFVDRLVQNYIGDTEYGKYAAVFNFTLIGSVLLDLGLNNFFAMQTSMQDKKRWFVPLLQLKLWISIFFIFVWLILGLMQKFPIPLLSLLVFNQVLASVNLFFRSYFQASLSFKKDAIASVLDRFIAIVLFGLFYFFLHQKHLLLYFVLAQTVGYIFTLVFSLLNIKKSEFAFAQQFQFLALFKKIWQQSKWFIIMALFMAVFTRIDVVLLQFFSTNGAADAGVYAKAFRLLDAALIFSSLISVQLLPLFSKYLSEKKDTQSLIEFAAKIVLVSAVLLIGVCVLAGSDIYFILYHQNYEIGNTQLLCFVVVMATFLPMALVHVFGTFLTAAGRMKKIAQYAIVCVVLNLLINFFTISKWGYLATAFAAFVTQSVFALFCCAKYWQFSKVKFNTILFTKVCGLFASNALLIWGSFFIETSSIYKVILYVAFNFIFILVFKLFKRFSWYNLANH